jgi:hypothetical protein
VKKFVEIGVKVWIKKKCLKTCLKGFSKSLKIVGEFVLKLEFEKMKKIW